VSNPDKALTILPVVLLAQFLLSGALFDVSANPVLKPVSYVTSARWGFAAAASTANMKTLPSPSGCPEDNGSKIPPSAERPAACDAARDHSKGAWFGDLIWVLVLTLLPMILAWVWVRRIGRPKHT